MKKRQHLLPCGRVIYFKEYTHTDISKTKPVYNAIIKHKKEFRKLADPDIVGRKLKPWSQNVYSKFATMLTKHLADRLLDGDRITTTDDHVWMVAVTGDGGKKHSNWHSDGKQYGVVIRGIKSKFGVRLSGKRRRQLEQLIKGGKTYHV
jgi:hypothetical protein